MNNLISYSLKGSKLLVSLMHFRIFGIDHYKVHLLAQKLVQLGFIYKVLHLITKIDDLKVIDLQILFC